MSVHVISWLQSHLSCDESATVDGNYLYSVFCDEGGACTKAEFGRSIVNSFPATIPIRSWSKFSQRTGTVYKGVTLKVINDPLAADIHEEFSTITKFLPVDVFAIVMKKNPQQIHAGLLCDVYINGNQLMKEIIFHIDYTWELIVCETKVNLSRLKIDEQFSFSEASVKNVCELVSKLKLCNGDSKTDIANLEENRVLFSENWGSPDGTNTKVIRSIRCHRVLPVTSLVSVCIGCRKNIYMYIQKHVVYKKCI